MNTEKQKKQSSKAVITWRVRLLQLSFVGLFGFIFCKAFLLQTMMASSLKKVASQQRRHCTPTTIFRGEITDRNGVVLAVDTARYDVFLRPKDFKSSPEQKTGLAKIIKINEEKLEEIIKRKYISKLATSISRSKADSIAQLKISGLDIIPTNFRDYPHKELAAHLLGFVSWDSSGQGGVEQYLNNSLTSAKSEASTVVSRGDGKPLIRQANLKPIINSSFGKQVELTIDSKLQYKVEEILNSNLSRFQAKRATAIIMVPQTGEILAWANSPSFDPNHYGSYPLAQTVNWAISEVYEPGSTFKVLTVASALQLGAIKPDYKYVDEGKITIGNRTIRNHDYKPGKVKEIGLVDLFRYSSNTAAASIGAEMKADAFYNELLKFGISQKTGIEVPGESSGFLREAKKWKEIDLATTSFGQGAVAVTPIQLAAAINTVANRGTWVQPHLIKNIKSADGRHIVQANKFIKRRVVSSGVAKKVSEMLAESISKNLEEDESYLAGNIPGYEVAGKTGTAQKYCPKLKSYCPGETIASFIGFFPAANPSFLVLVVVDSPAAGGGWGNTVAGPIFNQIGEVALKIYPQGLKKEKNFMLFN